jgi:hypothetical protein
MKLDGSKVIFALGVGSAFAMMFVVLFMAFK